MNTKNQCWTNVLYLEEIQKLFYTLAHKNKIGHLSLDNISLNEKKYHIELMGNCLSISCTDGRKIELSVFFQEKQELGEANSRWISTFQIDYVLDNQKKLYLSGNVDLENRYEFNSIPYNLETIVKEIQYYFHPNRFLSFDKNKNIIGILDKNGSKKDSNPHFYWFVLEDNQVVYYNRNNYILSLDGSELIQVGNKRVPPLEEVKKFHYEEEVMKLKELLEKNPTNLHVFTLEMISSLMKKMYKQALYKEEIFHIYKNIIPYCQEALSIRSHFLTHFYQYIFTQEELILFHSILEEEIKKKNHEREIEEINSQKRVKKLMKQLTSSELNVLRKELNKK